MNIGLRLALPFRHRRRWRRNSLTGPTNHTVGALYVVVAAMLLVSIWIALDGVFDAPPPSEARRQMASSAAKGSGFVHVSSDAIGPLPQFDKPIELVDVDPAQPQSTPIAPEAAQSPETAGVPEAAPATPADALQASATSESPADAALAPAPRPESQATARATGEARGSGKFRLQLAAVKSAAAGERVWDDLRRRQGDLLGGLKATVSPAEVPELGRVYRVRTAPVQADDARRMCDTLRQRQVPCHLVR